ncbi:MAG: hypothetical protein ABJZ55_19490 [Fuerstiella sp.]
MMRIQSETLGNRQAKRISGAMDRPDTSIQTHLQRTLQFVVAVIVVTSCCLQARAQEVFVSNTYTVIGDVLHPNTYPWPPGQRVSIQMALQQAGFDGPSGTAVVRTALQPDRIIPGSAYLNAANPLFLNPGDTVVWRSIKGSRLKSGHVAILTDQGPRLQAIPIKGVDLGTLLETARLRFDQPVVAHRNTWGNEHSFPMQSNAVFVKHGDVLDVRAAVTRSIGTRSTGTRSTGTRIAGNQRSETLQTEKLQTAMAKHDVRYSATNTVAGTQPEPRSQAGIVRPVSHPLQTQHQSQTQAPLGGLRVPPVPQSPQTADTSPFVIPAALPNADNALQIPNAPFDRTNNLNSSEDSTSSNLAFFESVESPLQSNTFESAATPDLEQLVEEASHPNANEQNQATQSFLSGVFLFGLVLAIGLITVGIVRTRQEQRLALESQILTTTRHSPNSQSEITAKQQGQATLADAPAAQDQILFSVVPAATSESAQQSTPSESTQNESNVDESVVDVELENCPVLSVGLKEPEITVEPANPSTHAKQVQLFESSSNELLDSQPASTHVSAYSAVDLSAWLTDDLADCNLTDSNLADHDLANSDLADSDLADSDVEDIQQADQVANETATDLSETESHVAAEASEQLTVEEVSNSTQTLQLRNAKASSSPDFNSDDPILELPDVDALKTALAITEQTAKQESVVTDAATLADQIEFADTSIEADVIDSPQTIQDQEDIMAHPPMTQAEAQYLEDLIQNRLPMELSETHLPLRINLFGKPEGPRRLRIDAAHTTIAPPHMASSAARAKRREPAMAMNKDVQSSNTEQATPSQPVSTTDSSVAASQLQNSEATSSITPSQSQNPTSGLDKALNFLEEQSKS